MNTKEQVLAKMWALLAEIESGSPVGYMLWSKLDAYVDIMEDEDIPEDMCDTICKLGLAYVPD